MTKPSALIPRHPCNSFISRQQQHRGHRNGCTSQESHQGTSGMVESRLPLIRNVVSDANKLMIKAVLHNEQYDHHDTNMSRDLPDIEI